MTFRLITADPAWKFQDGLPGNTRGASSRYETMSTRELCRLVLPPVADDAVLVCWRVAAMMLDALQLVHAWGFTPKSELVWRKVFPCWHGAKPSERESVKPYAWDDPRESVDGRCPDCARLLVRAFAMGRYVRMEHEVAIIATRGRGLDLVRDHSTRSTFCAPFDNSRATDDDDGGHSVKPEAFRTIVERMFTGPRAELFARREVPGWVPFGTDVGERLELGPPRVGNQLSLVLA
jgi:N6-adenosine-specific RNA methylase IME4